MEDKDEKPAVSEHELQQIAKHLRLSCTRLKNIVDQSRREKDQFFALLQEAKKMGLIVKYNAPGVVVIVPTVDAIIREISY